MAERRIIWSVEAKRSFNQILVYYHTITGNGKYGKKLIGIIRDSLKLAARYPFMYRASSVKDARVFVCEYFRVYYSVHQNHILVESIFDTRQDPSKDIYQ